LPKGFGSLYEKIIQSQKDLINKFIGINNSEIFKVVKRED